MRAITRQRDIVETKAIPLPAGMHLLCDFEMPYDVLQRKFGEPEAGDDHKVDAQWTIKTPAGLATIYNYKNGRNYLGDEGTPTTQIRHWRIGGRTEAVVSWIYEAIFYAA